MFRRSSPFRNTPEKKSTKGEDTLVSWTIPSIYQYQIFKMYIKKERTETMNFFFFFLNISISNEKQAGQASLIVSSWLTTVFSLLVTSLRTKRQANLASGVPLEKPLLRIKTRKMSERFKNKVIIFK